MVTTQKFNVTISSDGSCKNNPGPGAYYAIVRCKGHERIAQGYCPETTNNKMELRGVIEGIKLLAKPCNIILRCDSNYVLNNFQRLDEFKSRGWKQKNGKAIANSSLWKELDELRKYHSFQLVKVDAHSGDPDNERCDANAKAIVEAHMPKRVEGSLHQFVTNGGIPA